MDEWLGQRSEEGDTAQFVMTSSDLQLVDAEETDYLFGLFAEYHIEYDHERQPGRDPSIAEMTEKAIQVRPWC